MHDIFLYRSPKIILRKFLEELAPEEKKGANQRLAQALGIFPSYLSLLLSGERLMNLDQGIRLADYMKLELKGRRFLLRVIELERANTDRLKEELNLELDEMIKNDHQIASKVEKEFLELNTEELLEFFSSWEYTAIHLSAALDNGKINMAQLSKRYHLSSERIRIIISFLLKSKLWKKNEDKIELGNRRIHLDQHSLVLNEHHRNWRLKAISRHAEMDRSHELAYSLCIALSNEDVLKVKSEILKAVEGIKKIADPSESEVLYNLNIDWLRV